jgi:hypothetical protein
MAQTLYVIVSRSDRARLETIAADRNRPQKHAKRASVVLASMAGGPVQREPATYCSEPFTDSRWRLDVRLLSHGTDSLRDREPIG